jgi:hypothetical protein
LAHPEHVKFPYLLRGMEITQANHVWSADITYLPMAERILLSCSNHGLGQPNGSVLVALQYPGQLVLCGCT